MDEPVAICLVVSKVLVADGMMTPAERELLGGMMEELGLSPEQRQAVHDLQGLDEAEQVVAAFPLERRREVVDQALSAALVDGKLSPLETEAIRQLSERLGV